MKAIDELLKNSKAKKLYDHDDEGEIWQVETADENAMNFNVAAESAAEAKAKVKAQIEADESLARMCGIELEK